MKKEYLAYIKIAFVIILIIFNLYIGVGSIVDAICERFSIAYGIFWALIINSILDLFVGAAYYLGYKSNQNE